jgi:hypothetical protein
MGVSGQRHAPAALYPRGKDPRYPLYRRLGWLQSRSRHRGYRKNPLPLLRIEPLSPGRPARSQTLYWLSYPAPLLKYLCKNQQQCPGIVLVVSHVVLWPAFPLREIEDFRSCTLRLPKRIMKCCVISRGFTHQKRRHWRWWRFIRHIHDEVTEQESKCSLTIR